MIGTHGGEEALASSTATSLAESAVVNAARVLATFPGATCLLDAAGRVVCANIAAEPLTLALEREAASRGDGPLLRLARQASLFGRPQAGRASISGEAGTGAESGPRAFNVTALPCERTGQGPYPVLLLAIETTHERNLTEALVASRDFFRDLVACSADFAWETDATGAFVYVSPRGAIGYTASELNGRQAVSLIDSAHDAAIAGHGAPVPFSTSEPVEDVEIWLKGADGSAHSFLISALPVHDAGGRWRGARGVGRDITALRMRELELERAHARERVSRAIVDAMLSERDFNTMLAAAARALAWAAHSVCTWILCREPSGTYAVGAAYSVAAHGAVRDLPPGLADQLVCARDPLEKAIDGWTYLGAPTRLHGAVNGAICIARPAQDPPFQLEERALVELVARHTAVAIGQAEFLRSLSNLSRTDDLTGLINRRGFLDAYVRWQRRPQDPLAEASFLYIDLDNFKIINDRDGHARGDEILHDFGNILLRNSRRHDVAVRLGGDEFALWLEGVGRIGAITIAERLLKAAREESGAGEIRGSVGLSIGIAVTTAASREDIESLLRRADRALYEAKRRGKGCWVLADPAPAESASEVRSC
jgi:diguanylate cyclase (GGDEF)-like protein/PAS domain S-box-containing protein